MLLLTRKINRVFEGDSPDDHAHTLVTGKWDSFRFLTVRICVPTSLVLPQPIRRGAASQFLAHELTLLQLFPGYPTFSSSAHFLLATVYDTHQRNCIHTQHHLLFPWKHTEQHCALDSRPYWHGRCRLAPPPAHHPPAYPPCAHPSPMPVRRR